MPFCRRCGDIVRGERCSKCGGTGVAAAVTWNQSSSSTPAETRDKWAQSYLSKSTSKPGPPDLKSSSLSQITNPFKEADKRARSSSRASEAPPPSSRDVPVTPVKAAAPIAPSTSTPRLSPLSPPAQPPRTPSPLKSSASTPLKPDAPDPTIVLNLGGTGGSLAKVYGSMLQPSDTLASFVCSACETSFPPDATIYPSLTNSKDFFCRECFSENGGIRGQCATCGKDVLRLKAEGGFIENFGRVWHSKCFRCEGCGRDISTRPMVDVLGKPCCDDCFDDCLNRGRNSARPSRNPSPASKAVSMRSGPGTPNSKASFSRPTSSMSGSHSNPGGMRRASLTPGLVEPNAVVEELAKRIGAPSPARQVSPDRDTSPRARPSSIVKEIREREDNSGDSPLSRTISERLAIISNPPSPSPETPPGRSPPKRFAGLDFRAPSKLANGTRTASPSPPSTASSPPRKSQVPERNTSPSQRPSSIASPGARNRTSSGLLTPSSTPTQSPRADPPAQPISFASPPGSGTRIPSLRGRHSFSSVASSPGGNSQNTSQAGTPTRKSSNSSSAVTPIRLPSVTSPKATGTNSAKSTPFKSNLPTIVSSPSTSPASTVNAKEKSRPSLTLAISPKENDQELKCGKCGEPLHGINTSGRSVALPVGRGAGELERFHAECFRCDACNGTFAETEGVASFVRYEGGVRHIKCAPTKRVQIFKHPSHEEQPPARSFDVRPANKNSSTTTARGPKAVTRPASMYASMSASSIPRLASLTQDHTGSSASNGLSRSTTAAPRFGSTTTCPGCRIGVSPMEKGIVPGPAATKWHSSCLVCGGKKLKRSSGPTWIIREEVKGPGCGKKLDSGAKGDLSEGILWCRDCWDMKKEEAATSTSPLSVSPVNGASMSIFPTSTSRPNSSLGIASASPTAAALSRQMNRGSGSTSPVRRPFVFPPKTTSAPLTEDEVVTEFPDDTRPEIGGRISPLKSQYPSGGRTNVSPVRPQYTGLRSASPIRRQFTGAGVANTDGVEIEPLAIQFTGGGVPITRQWTGRRPKSALGTRSFGSQKSVDEGRGMFLVRQMTGQAGAAAPSAAPTTDM